jgi:hypothetical protein
VRSAGGRAEVAEVDALDKLDRDGIRTVTLRTGGIPETLPQGFDGRDQIVASIENATVLGRAASPEDVGNAACSPRPTGAARRRPPPSISAAARCSTDGDRERRRGA